MGTRAGTRNWLGTLLAAVLLLALVLLVRQKSSKLAAAYQEIQAVKERLPDLPEVRSATRQRRGAFPVVWLQRVDGVERAVLMAPRYKGMEIDVVYDAAADFFDVGHPPVPSQGLSLHTLFSSIPRVQEHFFWIDFKNLTETNKQAACRRLLLTARKFGIVDHMIVESPNPRALSCFSENGFYTSYYLFPEFRLAAMRPEQVSAYYEEVKANLMVSRVNALSSSYLSLPFIEKYFPEADILLWYAEPREWRLRYFASLAYLRLRPHVKVILVHHWSPGFR